MPTRSRPVSNTASCSFRCPRTNRAHPHDGLAETFQGLAADGAALALFERSDRRYDWWALSMTRCWWSCPGRYNEAVKVLATARTLLPAGLAHTNSIKLHEPKEQVRA